MKKKILIPILLIINIIACTPSPESLVKEADYHYIKGEYQKAIDTFFTLVKKYPKSPLAPRALKRIGEIYLYDLHDEKEGITFLKKVAAYYPATTDASKSLLEIGEIQFEKGDYNSAISTFRQLLLYPLPVSTREKVFYDLIYSYQFINDQEDVIQSCESFLREFPKSRKKWEIMILEADTLFDMGNNQKGEALLKEVIDNAPENIRNMALYSLGNHYITLERYRDALVIFYKMKNLPQWKERAEKKISMIRNIIYNKHRFK